MTSISFLQQRKTFRGLPLSGKAHEQFHYFMTWLLEAVSVCTSKQHSPLCSSQVLCSFFSIASLQSTERIGTQGIQTLSPAVLQTPANSCVIPGQGRESHSPRFSSLTCWGRD